MAAETPSLSSFIFALMGRQLYELLSRQKYSARWIRGHTEAQTPD
jgi:hypothetical protein